MSEESTPAVLPCPAPPTNLRYWNGETWSGGPVATLWARVWGNAVDVVAASIIFSILFTIFILPFAVITTPGSGAAGAGTTLAFFAALLLGFVGYFALCYRFWGRTIGMLFAGTYIVHIPSGEASLHWRPAIVRALILCAGYICGVVWVVWLLLTATSRTKQGPHDLAARTAVLTSRIRPAQPGDAAQQPVSSSPDARAVPVDPPPVAPVPAAVNPEAAVVPQSSAAPGPAVAIPDEPPTPYDRTEATRAPLIFISHASQDGQVAQSLAAALEAQGLRTWLASRDVSIGANYAAEIFQSLVNSDYLLVILSPNSIESAHVRREVSIAIDRKVPVLPVSTDATGELMANLPEDWQYWLNIAQVFRMTDEGSTAVEIARRVS
jgi:uncharacterized RDD family membrane protein YckC